MKTIELSSGDIVLVDDSDYAEMSKVNWSVWKSKRTQIKYAKRLVGRSRPLKYFGKTVYMHRQILGIQGRTCADHIDGNGLNNQRSNLRICSQSQNMGNRRKTTPTKHSIFKGVSFMPKCRTKPWGARLKQKFLGAFSTEIEAAKRYNEEAIKAYGSFANLNPI